MRIGLAQINSTLGDFQSNAQKILDFAQQASLNKACQLVVFPEAALFGYNPLDLLEIPEVVQAQNKALDWLCKRLPPHVSILIGAVTENKESYGKAFHNSALLIGLDQTPLTFSKQLLPTYDVFDESRHIEPGCLRDNILKWNNHNILVTICEDIWGQRQQQGARTIYKEDPIQNISPNQVDLIINLGASPFTINKANDRLNMAQKAVRYLKAPLLYVNLVGGQDELIFDGGSFILNAQGELIDQSPYFEESLRIYEDKEKTPPHSLPDGFLSENPKSEKLTSEQLTAEKPTSEKPTSEKLTSEKLTSEKLTSEKPTSEKLTSEKLTSEKPSELLRRSP